MSEQLETIEDYYNRVRKNPTRIFETDDFEAGKSHFNITMRKHCTMKTPYYRHDYYRVSLIIGKGSFQYGAHTLHINEPALFLPSPNVPYSWEGEDNLQDGYFCLFNQQFFHENAEFNLFWQTSIFKAWSNPIIILTPDQTQLAILYFEQMYKLNHSTYPYRCNSIKNHLSAVMHLALAHRLDDLLLHELPANIRLYRLFDELLHKQFPLDSPAYPLLLKTASDFADQLNVHVNHLNASVKSVTQLTTTQIIKKKMLEEAKSLLKYTNWDIAEVGYTLGFEQPSHFNNFFKKHADISPMKFRQQF